MFLCALLLGFIPVGRADAPPPAPPGETTGAALLYSTYCSACHDTEVHWRDRRQAADWATLVAQVRHWQHITGLDWSDLDIEAVARYLNRRYYHYPEPAPSASAGKPAAAR